MCSSDLVCISSSVHRAVLPAFLLRKRTLFSHRLQVRNHSALTVYSDHRLSSVIESNLSPPLCPSLPLSPPLSPTPSNRCDPGFSGPAGERRSQPFPAFLSEGLSSPRLSAYHSFSSLRGAEVSFGCGVLASGKALMFNRDSRRHLVTAPLDSSQAR